MAIEAENQITEQLKQNSSVDINGNDTAQNNAATNDDPVQGDASGMTVC